jgi:hypothetical protein
MNVRHCNPNSKDQQLEATQGKTNYPTKRLMKRSRLEKGHRRKTCVEFYNLNKVRGRKRHMKSRRHDKLR